MADEANAWADGFNLGPERQLAPWPGDDANLIAGNYEQEQSERHLTAIATSLHGRDVEHWYRVLTYYYRALDIPQVRSVDDVWTLQWRILRLGICAAKSALGPTLVRYYVGAFGDIRQMAEYWFEMRYLELHPASVAGICGAKPGEKQIRLPQMGSRIRAVLLAHSTSDVESSETCSANWFVELVNKTHKRKSEGHHLIDLAIEQTRHPDDRGYYLGAAYHPSLVKEGLQHGTLMTITLALAATRVVTDLIPNAKKIQAAILAEMKNAISATADSPAGTAVD